MVSFHCDACTDVVKKPKLDHHYGQCRSSFTCIDCSMTFQGPAHWKGHTSCVTEAEKYQKALYAGPKKGSRPANGHQRNFAPKTTNVLGKYPQSLGTHPGWSRRQYIRDCASGANSTPLGSPRRMSPVDPLAVEPSLSSANAASVTEHREGKKRDSEAAVASHIPNGAEPKEKKRKRKHDDKPKEHNGGDVATADGSPAKVDRSSEKRRGIEMDTDGSLSKAQPPTEGNPQNSGDKKVKKRKKEKKEEDRSKQEHKNEEHIAPLEPVAPHADDNSKDEKRAKKRKHKEKREEGALAHEGNTEQGPLASETDGAKRNRKKRKEEEKAVVEVVGTVGEDRTRNDGEKKKRRRKRSVSVTV